jgi:vacuolar-type H+-ATPase subunit I/STV1
MSSDDPTRDLPDETKRTTQPTITAVFELVREVKQSVDAINARLDAADVRFDEMESRHARDFASLNARLDALSEEMRSGFTRLGDLIERIRQHGEADYLNFLARIRDLESKVS